MTTLDKRYDFVMLYDVINGNPNGDPDAGNAPRIDPETGHGLVSDVCLKRKIRDFVSLAKTENNAPLPGYDIYVSIGAVLNAQHDRAYEAEGLKQDAKKKSAETVDKARAWMCQTFFDIRTFGAVMTTGTNCGQVRGPVQLAFSRSIDPIVSLEQTITRKAVTKQEDADKQIAKDGSITGTMGRKEIVPYGLYRVHGFINPFLAEQTGFSKDDLALLWQALQMMFEQDHSATRGEMATRKLIVFQHESKLGNAPAHTLFDRVNVSKKDPDMPPRAFRDYEVKIDEAGLPNGISLDVKL